MSKKHRAFKIATSGVDFKKTCLVVKELISAIEHYKRFEMFNIGGDIENSTSNLMDAGTIAYRSMEHAYKNYIYRYYKDKFENSEITQTEFDHSVAFLSIRRYGDSFATHKDLKDKFYSMNPKPVVDLELIYNGAKQNNNGPKHELKVPDPTSLKVQIGEMVRFFKSYISSDENYPALADTVLGNEYAWLEFIDGCDDFSSAFQFILVSPPIAPALMPSAVNLFSISWDLVVDFDPSSDENGLKQTYISSSKISPVTRTLSFADRLKGFRPATSPQWVMANGFSDLAGSVMDTYKAWRRKYGQNLSDVLRKFQSTYPKPIKMIIMPGLDEKYVRSIIESCEDAFVEADGITISGINIFILEGESVCLDIDDDFVKRTTLTEAELFLRLETNLGIPYSKEPRKVIPGLKPGTELSQDLYSKLTNFCEVVYIGIEAADIPDDVRAFYNGERPISWTELYRHKDFERRIYAKSIYKSLCDIMDSHPQGGFYDIRYKPGYGGTTLLRRIAWDFHESYPTIIINQYVHEDISCLKQLYEFSKKPLLVLVDSNFVSRDTAKDIGVGLKSESISHAILYMRRMEKASDNSGKQQLFVLPELEYENGEIAAIIDMFLPFAMNKICADRIKGYLTDPKKCEERSPFYFAFSTFDEEFIGIRQYVKNFMKTLSPDFREFLVFMALADYINKPLDVQFYASVLRNDAVVDFLSDTEAFRTLVSFIAMPNRQMLCKIKYPAFANEILRQASVGFSGEDVDDIKYINLTEYILDFIEMSRPTPQIKNNDVVDFLRDMLITRRADLDSERPKFARLVGKIGSYNAGMGNEWSQEGQAAISQIFSKLLEVYPEDPHFRAHLARYLCYIEKAYDKAIDLLDEAIEMDADNSEEDPLLLHMKGMVYSARITRKTIPDIKRQHKSEPKGSTIEDELFTVLKSDLRSAENLFKQVRDMHKGIAGHISNVSLNISIIDLGKALDGTDTATFLEEHRDDWYLDLADGANNMFDECEDLEDELDDEDKQRVEDIRLQISTIRNGISKTISLYSHYLDVAPDERRPYIRRHLARAYIERNMHSNNQKDWQYIAELMAANIREEPGNLSNIRIWFNAILHIKTDDPDDMLRQAIIRLNEWVALSERNVEAQFYRYILTFVQATEGIMDAESRLPGYLTKLKTSSSNLANKTSIRYWLGSEGHGIEHLIPKDKFPLSDVGKANSMLKIIKGRVSEKYVNNFHAYITAYNSDVFFNPNSTDGRINILNKNAPVVFGMGFSYDGPRAYNSSIKLYTGNEYIAEERLPPLEFGVVVKCKVIRNSNPHYINVNIVGYDNAEGSIAIESLIKPYDDEHRPTAEGPLLDAMVIRKKDVISHGGVYRSVWELTMEISNDKSTEYFDTNEQPDYIKQLREFQKRMNNK